MNIINIALLVSEWVCVIMFAWLSFSFYFCGMWSEGEGIKAKKILTWLRLHIFWPFTFFPSAHSQRYIKVWAKKISKKGKKIWKERRESSDIRVKVVEPLLLRVMADLFRTGVIKRANKSRWIIWLPMLLSPPHSRRSQSLLYLTSQKNHHYVVYIFLFRAPSFILFVLFARNSRNNHVTFILEIIMKWQPRLQFPN